MFVCTCLYPRILTFSYSQVHVPSLKSLHPHIRRFACAYACYLVSSHPLILRLMYFVCLLVSSHPHILISLGSCTLGACWYSRILTSSCPYVHVLRVLVGILAFSHPHILRLMYSGCLLLSSHPHILISLRSCALGACWYPRILTSSYPQVPVFVLILTWIYFHITREPCLVSIPQVGITTSADKVDIILYNFTRLSFFCGHGIVHSFTVNLFCIL